MDAVPGGLGMLRNSILYPIFDKVMKMLIPSGIPQYLPEFHENLYFKKYHDSSLNMPRILTVYDLAFGFILWLTACGVSTIGFVAELLSQQIVKGTKILLKPLKDLFGLMSLMYSIENILSKF